MDNRKFNVIFGLIGIVLLIILINIFYIYRRNENSKISFDLTKIINNNWINDDTSFNLKNNTLTFRIDDEDILKSKKYNFNNRTGKFEIVGSDIQIYLRSIGRDSIIIWYDNQEFNLKKEVIAR